jgi:hypothetical protein
MRLLHPAAACPDTEKGQLVLSKYFVAPACGLITASLRMFVVTYKRNINPYYNVKIKHD